MLNLDDQFDTVSEANDGAVMEVQDKFGQAAFAKDGTAMTITLLGKDSDAWVANERKATNRRLAAGSRLKLTSEGLSSDAIANLALVTKGWTGFFDETGQPWPCTYDNARVLYTRYPLIKEQASAFVDERANFSKASSGT